MSMKERNRAAAAGYARAANARDGTPIPSHLRGVTPSLGPSRSGSPGGPAAPRAPGGGIFGYTGLLDMFDGGGAGRSGQRFEGGPFSGLLNELGVRPMGYRDRMSDARPMPRPTDLTTAPAMAPQPPAPGQVSASPMIGNLTTDDILAAIQRGAPVGPRIMQPPRMPTMQELMERQRLARDMEAALWFDRSGFTSSPPPPFAMTTPPVLGAPATIAPLTYSTGYPTTSGYGRR
ncbi:MAG: hypothetical protein RLZ51_1858 [Pseudomonadota bacterium]|jgi:hypothetical protein